MSYCRWSSDNWKCDLYCYRSSDGYITHVAGNRVKGDVSVVPAVYAVSSEEFSKADRAQMDVLKNADRIAIDLQHAGETFIDPTLESFLDRVLYLKELGYNVPDFTIDNIKEEIAEKKGSKL